jgi:hypothetical protein
MEYRLVGNMPWLLALGKKCQCPPGRENISMTMLDGNKRYGIQQVRLSCRRGALTAAPMAQFLVHVSAQLVVQIVSARTRRLVARRFTELGCDLGHEGRRTPQPMTVGSCCPILRTPMESLASSTTIRAYRWPMGSAVDFRRILMGSWRIRAHRVSSRNLMIRAGSIIRRW